MPHWALCAFCCHCKPQLSVCLSAGNRRWPWAHEGKKKVNIQIRITHHLCLVWHQEKKQNKKKKQKFRRKSKVVLFLLQERGGAELSVHFYKFCLPKIHIFFPFRHQMRTNMWKSVLACKDDLQRADSTRCKTMRFTQKVGHGATERLTNRRLIKLRVYFYEYLGISLSRRMLPNPRTLPK